MPPQRVSGYVLHVRPFRESSAMVRLLTPEDGAVDLAVRGARSTKRGGGGGPQIYDFISATVSDRASTGAASASALEVEYRPAGVRDCLETVAVAAVWWEMVRLMAVEGAPGEVFFALMQQFVEHVSKSRWRTARTVILFRELMVEGGFAPRLDACVRGGGRTDLLHFDPRLGGVVSAQAAAGHQDLLPLSEGSLALMRSAAETADAGRDVGAVVFTECLVALVRLFEVQADVTLRSVGMLYDALGFRAHARAKNVGEKS